MRYCRVQKKQVIKMNRDRLEMFVEGDGETDQYGLRIKMKRASYVIRGLSREEMNFHLKDLVDQFLSLSACFDAMSQRS